MAVSKLTECKDETSACVSMPDGPPTPRAERHHRCDARLKWADRGFSLVNIHLTAQWWMWPLRHSAPVNLKSLDKAVSQAATSPPLPLGLTSLCSPSVQISLPSKMYMSGLPHRYTAAQLHFHWGSASRPTGSEHLVNNRQYAAEVNTAHRETGAEWLSSCVYSSTAPQHSSEVDTKGVELNY